MDIAEYRIISPSAASPGMLCIVGTRDQLALISQAQDRGSQSVYVVRAIIGDHIQLQGSVTDIIAARPRPLVVPSENPLTIYLHHGGENAIYFDLRTVEGTLAIDVEVETDLPLLAFAVARTAINELLDTIMRREWLPLLVFRMDLFDDAKKPIAHQIQLPFFHTLNIGPLGGIHQFPVFSELESVAREAITAASPYYRFLCAYRLYEGIGPVRKWLRDRAADFGVSEPLPKDAQVDPALLKQFGLSPTLLNGVRTVSDLHARWTDLRNSVAHFLLTKGEAQMPLHLADGFTYANFSVAGAVLLHYAFISVRSLYDYFQSNIDKHFSVGRLVLPQIKYREQFRLRLNSRDISQGPDVPKSPDESPVTGDQ